MRCTFLAGLAVACTLAGCGAPDETSSGGGSTSTGWTQTDVAAADLDGDGRVDVVTLATRLQSDGTYDGTLTIYRQTTTGIFAASTIQIGRYPWRVKIADIDGDGAPDLLVLDVIGGSGANDDVLYLLRQDAANRGRFLAARTVASGLAASDFAITDINLDAAPDLVIAGVEGGGDGASQYLQRPVDRGSFAAATRLDIAGRVQQLAVGAVGGNARSDLVSYSILDTSAASNSPGQLVVAYSTLLADALGTSAYFLTPGRVLAAQVGLKPQAMAVADVDGNVLQDVIVCFTPITSAFAPKLSVVLQDVLGQFEVVDTSLSGISGLDSFVIADLNGDARPDVASTGVFTQSGATRSRVNVLVPSVGGRYLQTSAIDMPVPMYRISAADVNGDGLMDLVLLGDSNRAYVMYQSATSRGTFSAPRQL